MVSSKLIVLACLLAITCATPLTLGVGPVGGSGGLILNGGGNGGVSVGGGLGGLVGGLLNGVGSILSGVLGALGQGLTNIAGNAKSIFSDLANLRIPATIDDVLNLLISLGVAVGDVVNVLLPGVGSSLAGLLVGLFKILICALGSPGLTGALLGDRTPGQDNPSDIPAICLSSYGSAWGLNPYTGSSSDASAIINFYGLAGLEAKILAAINLATNGGGVLQLNGNARYIVQWLLQLLGLCKKTVFSKTDLVTVVVNLVSIVGAIANSITVGLGELLVADLVAKLSIVLNVLLGLDLKVYIGTIKQNISVCKKDSLNGAVNVNVNINLSTIGSGSSDNNGGNNGNTGGDNGNGNSGNNDNFNSNDNGNSNSGNSNSGNNSNGNGNGSDDDDNDDNDDVVSSGNAGVGVSGLGNVVGGVGTLLNGVVTGVGGLLGGVVNGVGNVLGGLLGGLGSIVTGVGQILSGALVALGVGLTNIAGDAANIFANLGRLRIPATIDDVFNLLINLGIAVGGVVNAILPGVGTAVGGLVVGLLKVLVCVLGSPGLLGAIFGDRTPGLGGVPILCTPKFGPTWGIPAYNGPYTNSQAVLKFYKLAQLEAQILAAVNEATNGGGVVALQGNARFIVEWLLQIVRLCKKNKLSEADFVTLVVTLVTITGGIGNSCKAGLGAKLVADLLNKLSVVLNADVLAGANLKTYVTVCTKRISVCKRDSLYGTVNLSAKINL
ncbi:hypothetical protein ACJJTC_015231 [Scirpophaga incertulas]